MPFEQREAQALSCISISKFIVRPLPCRFLLLGGLFLFQSLQCFATDSEATPASDVPSLVKQLFRQRCFKCHGQTDSRGMKRIEGGLNILDYKSLTDGTGVVKPTDPQHSALLTRLKSTDDSFRMPKDGARLSADEIALVEAWIATGAIQFPDDKPFPKPPDEKNLAGVEYVLASILKHVQSLPEADKPFIRYLSINHILAAGSTDAELDTYRYAFVKAANHLSLITELYLPTPIDDTKTVFAVDIRKLGWDRRPFEPYQLTLSKVNLADYQVADAPAVVGDPYLLSGFEVRPSRGDYPLLLYAGSPEAYHLRYLLGARTQFDDPNKAGVRTPYSQPGESTISLYDLILLEYPYGAVYSSSETFRKLTNEFLLQSKQLLPIVYIRADWFASVATLPPLYYDLLLLPNTLAALEARLGVDVKKGFDSGELRRAGMAFSGVSKNNRAVERHLANRGYYWKSFDFASSKGTSNIFKDPVELKPLAGEFIFSLGNDLQGYFIADANGRRLDAAATDVVTDEFASDRIVRPGLSCIRCHDRGMKDIKDIVSSALKEIPDNPGFDKTKAEVLYRGQAVIDGLVKKDRNQFESALRNLAGGPVAGEPLRIATRNFLDVPLNLRTATAELGYGSIDGRVFAIPAFTKLGLLPLLSESGVRRDAWDDYYDRIVEQLGTGHVIIPFDGLTRLDANVGKFKDDFDLDVAVVSTPPMPTIPNMDCTCRFVVLHRAGIKKTPPLYVEVIAHFGDGRSRIAFPKSLLQAKEVLFYPVAQYGEDLRAVSVFFSDGDFPGGEAVRTRLGLLNAHYCGERVVHRFVELSLDGSTVKFTNRAQRVVKKSVLVHTAPSVTR